LLQGGDCAESFDDCESDNIARRLKILLQMSLVLLQGLRKPVIRVGDSPGNMPSRDPPKPRPATGSRCPVIAATVNRRFHGCGAEPDPELLLRGYERSP